MPIRPTPRPQALQPTVADLIASGLFGPAPVVAGRRGIDAMVRSITVLSSPEIASSVGPGDFALADGLLLGSPSFTLDSVIPVLKTAGCPGLGLRLGKLIDAVPDRARRTADDLGFPLIEVPPRTKWGELVAAFCDDLVGRALRFQSQFQDICLVDYPVVPIHAVQGLLNALAQQFHMSVTVLDVSETIVATTAPHDTNFLRMSKQAIRTGVLRDGSLRVYPIKASDDPLGYLAILPTRPWHHTDVSDTLLHSMTKILSSQLSLLKTRQSLCALRSKLLEEAMAGDQPLPPFTFGISKGDLVRMIAVIAHDPAVNTKMLLGTSLTEDFEEVIGGPTASVSGALVGVSKRSSSDLNHRIADFARRRTGLGLACGMSRPLDGSELREALRETLASVRTAKDRFSGQCAIVRFEELGLLSLLPENAPMSNLAELQKNIVGKLQALSPNWERYFETLEIYLSEDCSAVKAARRLHVHPNTLKYRVQRIKSVLPMDTFEDKIRLYVALQSLRFQGFADFSSIG